MSPFLLTKEALLNSPWASRQFHKDAHTSGLRRAFDRFTWSHLSSSHGNGFRLSMAESMRPTRDTPGIEINHSFRPINVLDSLCGEGMEKLFINKGSNIYRAKD